MRIKEAVVFLLIFLSLNQGLVFSQEFTLKEAMDYALEHNPNIIIAKNKIEKAKVILKDSQRRLDLNISLQLGYSPLVDRRGIGFGVSQDLDRLLGGNKKEKDLALLDLDSAKSELFLVQQRVVKEVTEAFGNLESTKHFLGLKKENNLDSKKSLDLAKEKFDLGIISLDEFLAKQQQLRQVEFEFQQAEKEFKEAYLVFYQAIGYKQELELKD